MFSFGVWFWWVFSNKLTTKEVRGGSEQKKNCCCCWGQSFITPLSGCHYHQHHQHHHHLRMTLRIIIKYRIIIRAKQKRVMVMVVGTGQKVMPACREGPGERKERKKPKKNKKGHCKIQKGYCQRCTAVGVVPFASESVRHERVVPVSSSSVCAAAALKHQTAALPFFPSYLLPFPPTHPLFFFLSSICHWSLLPDPPLGQLFLFSDTHRTHLHLPRPMQRLHWDSLTRSSW